MKLFGFWRSLASFRVRIALNLKGVSFEEVSIDLMAGQQRSPDYAATNPQMVVPALAEDGGAPLFQSLAILEYLEECYPKPALLPADPRGRARVRGLAQIIACDTHPLIVPRVREYLEHELGLDEPRRLKWIHHWMGAGLGAVEAHLSREPETGLYCHGDAISIADLCVTSQAVGLKFFGGSMEPYPITAKIVERCMGNEAFARAHPLRQPGAPASV
ncbi:MAG: maleylacetoacetate isomerase [Pseudomonadota bacterium]|nr:maleylacetoacetate isomerase [Pseudomonadota bacterium]